MRRFFLPELAAFFLLAFVYDVIVRSLLAPIIQLPALLAGIAVPLTLALFSLFHAIYLLGWRNALGFVTGCLVISWSFEQVGVATGLVYGNYYYTNVLGIKLGHVPLIIPVAWFMMMYPSHVMANLISSGTPKGGVSGFTKAVPISFLTAIIMTAWDLTIDPLMSGPDVQAWIWKTGGPYFGIPLQNFVGWLLTAFVLDLLYRCFVRRIEHQEFSHPKTLIEIMPVGAYATMMIMAVILGGHPGSLPVALLFMGPPVVGAIVGYLFSDFNRDNQQGFDVGTTNVK